MVEYKVSPNLVNLTESDLRGMIDLTKPILESGPYDHGSCCSDFYFDLQNIQSCPRIAGRISSELIEWTRLNVKNNIEIVMSSILYERFLTFDIVLAFNREMHTRAVYIEHDEHFSRPSHPMKLTYASRLSESENVLVVLGLVKSNELVDFEKLLDDKNAKPIGVISVATPNEESREALDRMCKRYDIPSHNLIDFDFEYYKKDRCPHKGAEHHLIPEMRVLELSEMSVLQFTSE